jgi:hypothetical protein
VTILVQVVSVGAADACVDEIATSVVLTRAKANTTDSFFMVILLRSCDEYFGGF